MRDVGNPRGRTVLSRYVTTLSLSGVPLINSESKN